MNPEFEKALMEKLEEKGLSAYHKKIVKSLEELNILVNTGDASKIVGIVEKISGDLNKKNLKNALLEGYEKEERLWRG